MTLHSIFLGSRHTCAVLDDRSVKCWGWNDDGQLGYGDTIHRGDGAGEMGDALPAVALGTGRTAVSIAAGYITRARCWTTGQSSAGAGTTTASWGTATRFDRGDGAGEMGDALPAVALGTGRTAVSIAAGMYHTCAVLDDRSVKCWGWNDDGQLGYGDTIDRGDGAGEMGDALPAVALGTGRTAVSIAAGCITRARCWTTGQSSAGAGTTTASWGTATRLIAGTVRGRWATRCRLWRWGRGARRCRSRRA